MSALGAEQFIKNSRSAHRWWAECQALSVVTHRDQPQATSMGRLSPAPAQRLWRATPQAALPPGHWRWHFLSRVPPRLLAAVSLFLPQSCLLETGWPCPSASVCCPQESGGRSQGDQCSQSAHLLPGGVPGESRPAHFVLLTYLACLGDSGRQKKPAPKQPVL